MLRSLYRKDETFTLGILGGGQLAKMLAFEAYRMGLNLAIIEKRAASPAGDMTHHEFPGGWEDDDELNRFIEASDVITLENEFVDPHILEKIAEKRTIFPNANTLYKVQDKYIQKKTFAEAGLPVPHFEKIDSLNALLKFGQQNGYPHLIKARKYGYDGYGNATVFNEEEAKASWEKFNEEGRKILAEKFVDFQMELAVMATKNKNGEYAVYPTVETVQYRHICHNVSAPAEIDPKLRKKAQELAVGCVDAVEGTGIFGIEFFLTKDNEILINEIAPRPHNTGHYTIEACYTSQFENAIRAVCGLPLGSPKMIKPAAAMVNLLGEREGNGQPEDVTDILRHKNAWLHLYNKKKSRVGRKMGHVTALGDSNEEAMSIAKSAAEAINW